MKTKLPIILVLLSIALMLAVPIAGQGQSLDQKIDGTRAELERNRAREGKLSSGIDSVGERISGLEDQIDVLSEQEASTQQRLDQKQTELEKLRAELELLRRQMEKLRARLARSQDALSDRLVALYKADEPDLLTVVLESNGFNDLLERTAFLERISEQDQEIVERTATLKRQVETEEDQVAEIEGRVAAAVDEIAARRDQIAAARSEKQQVEGDLTAVRQDDKQTLTKVEDSSQQLESHLRELEAQQARVQAQLAGSAGTFDPGPIKEGSGELIWPVNAAITSPFGQRWGRLHAGIDMGAGEGTPIRAAEAGKVVLASPYGGYGNYTCVQHAGGLSTCYAHQSSIGVSVGESVDQGQVIGNVGNTGASFGAHLHFETRVSGTPQDPMGYL